MVAFLLRNGSAFFISMGGAGRPGVANWTGESDDRSEGEQGFALASFAHNPPKAAMQAIVASTVKHTTTSTSMAAISTRPARAAATAARSALTAKDRSRSPSSSLSPVPPSPQDNVYDPAAEALGSPRDVAGTSKGEQVKVEDDEVEEPKPKKKRTRKPKEPVVYEIPPVEQLTTTFKCVHQLPSSLVAFVRVLKLV